MASISDRDNHNQGWKGKSSKDWQAGPTISVEGSSAIKEHMEEVDMQPGGACPECDADVAFESRPEYGALVRCPLCQAQLVVIGLRPIELDWAFLGPTQDAPYSTSESGLVGRPMKGDCVEGDQR